MVAYLTRTGYNDVTGNPYVVANTRMVADVRAGPEDAVLTDLCLGLDRVAVHDEASRADLGAV